MEKIRKEWLDFLREQYPEGTRIKLNSMSDPFCPVLPGTKGTVQLVDDAGTIHMKWDNGRTLGLIIPNTTFEIRRAADDALVDTVTTGYYGWVYTDLEAGTYYALEIKAADGYRLDSTPHYFEVKDGESTTVVVTNQPLSGISSAVVRPVRTYP